MNELVQMQLMQKVGIIAQLLAEEFLGMDVGQRLLTVEALTKKHNTSRGTIQQSLQKLKDLDAIILEPQGHLGTYIKDIDYTKLLSICSTGNLVGVMPLPYSKRYEGLATGIYTVLNENAKTSVNLAFMGGSDRRLQAMLDGRYNFAIMSLSTAKNYVEKGYDIDISYRLTEHTYVNSHALIMRKDFNKTPVKIGVDSTSFDQLSMTTKYFQNQQIEIVPLQYSHVIESIKNGNIDAGIWSLEEKIKSDNELKFIAIDNIYDKQSTSATIVIKKDDTITMNFMKRFFNVKDVESIQKRVQDNIQLPNY